MKRVVEPELLDELPQNDPLALGSRRDLRRLNFFMGNVGIVQRLLLSSFPEEPPKRIVELGAGDGTFMLEIARTLSGRWPNLEILLVDQQNLVSAETMEEWQRLGWRPRVICADVFDWLAVCEPVDCMFANLFLHHFSDEKLGGLLKLAAPKTNAFLACEPRRSSCAIFGTKFLWLMGCNEVTRHDAAVSVRAGFKGDELSQFWPQMGEWKREERATGLFSHSFAAGRR